MKKEKNLNNGSVPTEQELAGGSPAESGGELFDRMRINQSLQKAASSSAVLSDVDGLFVPQDSNSGEVQATVEASSQQVTSSPEEGGSGMVPAARRSLVYLLRQGVILASKKAKLFESLCRHQNDIRRHLAEVYLKLILDEKTGVAFVAGMQKEEEEQLEDFADNEVVSLITRRTLSLYDTLLLLVLRKHYQDRETSGEQLIIIDQERVESYLTPFLRLTNSSKSNRRKLGPALERMVKKKILRKVRGSRDRYEITPVIRYVVNAEFLEQMLGEYQRIAAENNIAEDSETGRAMNGGDDE